MSFHFTRSATAVALALSVSLLSLPACKKKTKPTVPDSPVTPVTPTPGPVVTPPGPGTTNSLPPAPKGPFFRGPTPLGAGVRIAAEKNMQQIAIALQNYESNNGALPAGYADKTGKAGLSWRVAILPYLEQDNLFKLFKLDEPWNSEHNKKLIDKMPKQFAPPSQSTYGYTFARAFTGPGTWLPPQAQPGTPGQALKGAKIVQFTDGTTTTFLVVEAGEAVIWTNPEEIPFDPKQPLPKLGGVFESGMVAGMADGSAKFVRKGADPKAIVGAIQINDGSIVNLDN